MAKILEFPKNENTPRLVRAPKPPPPRGRVVLRVLKRKTQKARIHEH